MKVIVDVYREDGQWLGQARDLPAAHTFARNLVLLDQYLREAIAVTQDLAAGAESSLDLDYSYHGVPQFVIDAAEIGRRRRQAEREMAEANLAARQAAATLKSAGYSVRDAAQLLEVSPGRISQMAA